MAQLIFIPQQIAIHSTDITLDTYEVLYDMKFPEEFDVEHEFLLMEFDDSKFSSISSHYLTPHQCLWFVAEIKKFTIPKIAYYYSYNKDKKSLNLYVPEQFAEEMKKLLNNIGFFTSHTYTLEKQVDSENKSITFTYTN